MRKFLLLVFIFFFNLQLVAHEQESIVCIHGFMRNHRSMHPIGNTLKRDGYQVYFWDYPTRRRTIEGHAASLVAVLQEIAYNNPGKPIHFVTHSLGGIIARVAVNHPQCPIEAKMGRAVLLAPPNRGSSLARCFQTFHPAKWLFGEKSGYQLLTYNPEMMARLGQFPSTMKVMVIAGNKGMPFFFHAPNDGKVSVAETALDTPHTHVSISVSHSWIMASRQAIDLARKFIRAFY